MILILFIVKILLSNSDLHEGTFFSKFEGFDFSLDFPAEKRDNNM